MVTRAQLLLLTIIIGFGHGWASSIQNSLDSTANQDVQEELIHLKRDTVMAFRRLSSSMDRNHKEMSHDMDEFARRLEARVTEVEKVVARIREEHHGEVRKVQIALSQIRKEFSHRYAWLV